MAAEEFTELSLDDDDGSGAPAAAPDTALLDRLCAGLGLDAAAVAKAHGSVDAAVAFALAKTDATTPPPPPAATPAAVPRRGRRVALPDDFLRAPDHASDAVVTVRVVRPAKTSVGMSIQLFLRYLSQD